jgi:hypothetical protein
MVIQKRLIHNRVVGGEGFEPQYSSMDEGRQRVARPDSAKRVASQRLVLYRYAERCVEWLS